MEVLLHFRHGHLVGLSLALEDGEIFSLVLLLRQFLTVLGSNQKMAKHSLYTREDVISMKYALDKDKVTMQLIKLLRSRSKKKNKNEYVI